MTQQEIAVILENHQHWLLKDCENWENMRANLQNARLYDANLYRADLCSANLCSAILCRAKLRMAYLRFADICNADLRGADLCAADLCDTNLRGANLYRVDLRSANLCGANLCWADLRFADLRSADLRGADLRGADLYGTYLYGAKNIPFVPFICPDKGAFTGWKKCKNNYIVELLIPEEAKRLSSTRRKCRCDKAIVVSIQNINGSIADVKTVCSQYDENFFYTVGEVVSVDNFCEDRWRECGAGIHFFINRQEAVDYE